MPTPIQWCDETFNPWWGCERVSPACAHCYADTFAKRLGMQLWPGKHSGSSHAFRFFGDKHWDEPLRWARTLPAKLGRRPRVFCASMADVFEERADLSEHRERLFDVVCDTPELDWLILTKRPEFARDWFAARLFGGRPALPPNVWMGVSIENARYTWRADVLREIPAAVRFISAEPLLGSLFDAPYTPCPGCKGWLTPGDRRRGFCPICAINPPGLEPVFKSKRPLDLSGIDWVIIGGESGPKARPFHLEHAREIVRACREATCPDCRIERADYEGPNGAWLPTCPNCGSDADPRTGTAVFVKQLGAKPVRPNGTLKPIPMKLRDRKGGDMAEWPADLRIREFPRTAVHA